MSTTRIVTLFGEEITPDPPKPPVAKGRAKKKDQEAEEANEEERAAIEPVTAKEDVASESSVAAIAEQAPGTIEETPLAPSAETTEPEVISTPEKTAEPAPIPFVPDRRKLLATIRKTEPKDSPEVVSEPAKAEAIPDINTALTEVTTAPGILIAPEAETNTGTIAVPAKTARKTKAAKEEEQETGSTNEDAAAIIPEDWQGDKKYYGIGEVAALFSVKTSHIRFWTNEFKLKVRTTRKGDRLFTPEQIKELRTIYHLVKERGFTLTGAKTKLKTEKRRDITTIDLKDSLIELREKLQILRDQL